MTKLSDYYAVVLTSKWFYFSILATAISYLALYLGMRTFSHDYIVFGSTIASFDFPVLRFFFLTARYSIFFTEVGILSWAWYEPTTDPKFADVLPAGTPWEYIWLQFIDDDCVMIHAGRFMRQASYVDMGLADTRSKNPKPNEQWKFLLLLAKKGGEISPKDSEADERFKKQKEHLSKKLQRYFRLDTDPFYGYNERKAYHIRLKLMYPQEIKTVTALAEPETETPLDDLSTDIRESYAAQTPTVNDTDDMTRDWFDAQERKREKW